MKYSRLFKSLCAAMLVLICMLACGAFAEGEPFTAEMELFTAGDFPEPCLVQTFAVNSFDSYVYEQLMLGVEVIDISEYQITKSEISLMLTNVINDHPDLFFVGPSINGYVSSEIVTHYIPEYLFTGDDLKARQAAFNASVNAIANDARMASTTIGRLIRVNDYFCTHYSYDESLTIFRPDQLFSGGTGVCQAYMLGYAAVLDELDIPNTHATSTAMKHTWNLVNVGDEWYHIDVTWNDPLPDTALQARHRYFMLSNSGISAADHYGWTASAEAYGTAYDNAFWQSIHTPLAPVGNDMYYLSDTAPNGVRTVCNWDAATNTSSEIFSFSIVGANGSYAFSGALGPIAADSDYIYYGACGVLWAAAHDGSKNFPVYFTDNEAVHIWSCRLEGNTLSMRIGEPNGSMSIDSCPADQRMQAVFDPAVLDLYPGDTAQPAYSFSMPLPQNSILPLLSSDESIAAINPDGTISAAATGAAYITFAGDSNADSRCPVIVHAENCLVLPENLTELKKESFSGVNAVEVVLPEGIQLIGAGAFADCEELLLVNIPDGVENIHESAFPVGTSLTIICRENSAGAAYAQEQGINSLLLPEIVEE